MMTQVREIDWNDLEIAIPAFLTIVLMPFTWAVAVLFVIYFAIDRSSNCSADRDDGHR
jgi:xanthine/uracil/vitamin C permease (AzgA family)